MRRLLTAAGALVVAAASASGPARADDVIGLYLGGALGAVQQNYDPHVFDARGSTTGYKVELGVRPLPIVAAEVSYVDFGRAYGGINYADTNAVGVFALGYLPIPFIDVFGKVGLAEARTNAQATDLSFHHSGSNVAYGAGVGGHWGDFGVRVEYERYQVSHANDMGMASAGVTWTFL